jgi:AcrR family transcriptional regulator
MIAPPAAKNTPVKAAPGAARERLLDAAAVVFAREGIAGSTTREIAQAAGVNEVTLFRLFQNKQNLLVAVLERVFAAPVADKSKDPEGETDLWEIVRGYATSYAASLEKNLALKRVLIGEIQHFQEQELMVIRGIFEPTRQQLIGRLRAAQEAGLARKEMNPAIVADQINALIFMGALRHSLPLARQYGAREYLEECVETVVRGFEVPGTGNAGKRRKP